MEVHEFRKDLLEDARSTAVAEGGGTTAAFVNIFANYLIDVEVLPDFEQSFFLGTGYRGRTLRVDGYALDEFDGTMNLVVADFKGEEQALTLTRTQAEQVFEWPVRFIDEAFRDRLRNKIEISTPAADFLDTLQTRKNTIRKYRILLLTDSFMSDRIESFPISELDGVPLEYQVWDVQRLYKVCLADSGREAIEIDLLAHTPGGLPCLEASGASTGETDSYLCVIPGKVLADIYDQFGAQLLEGNVRSFLSTKVAVNRKIRETILSSPHLFFAFNNGISATVSELLIQTRADGKMLTYVKDFQIINGGQTTTSLSTARFRDKAAMDGVYVPMKLTKITAETTKAHELRQRISRSSNSQNKVSDADFFSTHPFHVRMETISRRLYAPAVGGEQHETHWFYERARGQYMQEQMRMTPSERRKFATQNPKTQLISKTDFAKVINSKRLLPHIVSKGAQANFTEFAEFIDAEWVSDSGQFNERFFQECVALYILFKHTEKVVSHEDWFEKGYRANIVTYTIALLFHLLKKQYQKYELDLQQIWNRQGVNSVLTEQIKLLSKLVFESITDTSRPTINVTQWCKREDCWKQVREMKVMLSPDMEKALKVTEDSRSEAREAKKDQQLISGYEAQARVIELGNSYWQALHPYVVEKRLLSSHDELSAIKVACQIPAKLPNAYQSVKLLSLADRAAAEGWKR